MCQQNILVAQVRMISTKVKSVTHCTITYLYTKIKYTLHTYISIKTSLVLYPEDISGPLICLVLYGSVPQEKK